MPKTCLIIGAGPAGLAAALSLSNAGIKCIIHELRPSPSTIGGSISLTPSALRILDSLEVEVHGCRVDSLEVFSLHSGKKLAELPIKKHGPGLRVMREELLRALLISVRKRGIEVIYGSRLVGIEDVEGSECVAAQFELGTRVEADFILGCDGIHSSVRSKYVEPSRKISYTKVAVAYTLIDAAGLDVHFKQTAMNSGRHGQLLTSYTDADNSRIYLGFVMSVPEEMDRQGWTQRAEDKESMLSQIRSRFGGGGSNSLVKMLDRVQELVFYPIYDLGPGGVWSKGKVLLLGDAAHCMPPQGESTGIAMEDGVLLARVLSLFPEAKIKDVFKIYEQTRKTRIDAAYKEAVFRWEGVKDRTWLAQKVLEWFIWLFLWWRLATFEDSFGYDVGKEDIVQIIRACKQDL